MGPRASNRPGRSGCSRRRSGSGMSHAQQRSRRRLRYRALAVARAPRGVSGPLGSRRQEHTRHGCKRLQCRSGRIEEPLPVTVVALCRRQGPYTPAIQVSRMHPIATDDPSETALPHAGENLLINKMTGQRRAAAPTGSLLLSSVPFRWRGIIVEQHRLPPTELPEHSAMATASLSTSVRSPAHSLGREDATDGKTNRPTLVTVES
jgi:hypothetical protein